MILTDAQRNDLLQRYNRVYPVPALAYGTVRDYCDSYDHLQKLATYQGDLKDFQRPWTVKAILGACPIGSQLLEIGAGEPMVAQVLTELGYCVTIVDPYDGSGRGPTDYEEYCRAYPDIIFHRAVFSSTTIGVPPAAFDCVYSISVLEHISGPNLTEVFAGIRTSLKPDGLSLHSIDHVMSGQGAEFHHRNLAEILDYQSALAGRKGADSATDLEDFGARLHDDIETFYLSASGHNLWRGGLPYDAFPFRKVISVLSCARLSPDGR